MPHNEISVKLEEPLAHLCGCSKAAKNSQGGDRAKEGRMCL